MNEQKINKIIERKIQNERKSKKTNLKERMADRVARFGGSWVFIIGFLLFVSIYIIFNQFIYPFDPYPYILLNLLLACLSVFQAPFILMSQNRSQEIDRAREENDYRVNLKTELEVRELHNKLDVLINETKTRANRTD